MLAVFSVPESERHKRHVLRSQLTRLGFGTAAPGVWIAPAHLHEATAEMLTRLELDAYADLFRGDHLAFGDLAAKVRALVGPRRARTPLPGVRRRARPGAADPQALRHADGRPARVRRLRTRAHRLAAPALPRPRAARGAAAGRTGSASARPTCSSRCGRASKSPRAPTSLGDDQRRCTATPCTSTSASASHSRLTPMPAIAGYSVPASRRHTRPISRACAR